MNRLPIPPPPPTPEIRQSILYLDDAKAALSRNIWNMGQLKDAIHSAKIFIEAAELAANIPKRNQTSVLSR